MAQHVEVLAVARLRPDPQTLRDLTEHFAEATRSNLRATSFSDEQAQTFDRVLAVLLNTLPPPSSR